jgi:hypothetical protein
VNNSARAARVLVSADGRGLVSQAGTVLLWETMRVTGLARGLSGGLARWRAPRAVHDPEKIVADLAAAVALGGDCLADIAVLRGQPALAGPVASDPVVSRLVRALAGDAPRALTAIRAARERAWTLAGDAAPGAGGGPVTIDLDATIVIAHSEKEQASPTWKKTFDLLTELPDVSAVQGTWASLRPIVGLSQRCRSPGRGSHDPSLIGTETGHTVLNCPPSSSSLPILDVS